MIGKPMYTLAQWKWLPSGNVSVVVTLPNLRRVTLIVDPKVASNEKAMAMIGQLVKRPFFVKDLP